MLDIKFIRDNVDLVKRSILLKNEKCDVDRLVELDSQRRQLIYDVEKLKKERNDNSKKIADLKKEKKDADHLIERTKQISSEIKDLDEKLTDLQTDIKFILDRIPNIPHPSTPEGKSSEDNVEVKSGGIIPEFSFLFIKWPNYLSFFSHFFHLYICNNIFDFVITKLCKFCCVIRVPSSSKNNARYFYLFFSSVIVEGNIK